jgi:hypothetical protein
MLITRGSKREALDKDDGAEAQPREEECALGGLSLPHLLRWRTLPPTVEVEPRPVRCCSNTNTQDGAVGEIEGWVDLEMERPAAGVGAERHLGGHQAGADDGEPTEDESAGGDTAASIDPLEDDALQVMVPR